MSLLRKQFSRRKFLSSFGAFGIGTAATGTYGKAFEAEWLEVGSHRISVSKNVAKKPFKILQLSDLHASRTVSLKFLNRAVDLGIQQQPDLICLTGDYITCKYDQWDAYIDILAKLSAAAPTFATLGNHDGGEWCGKHIKGYSDTTLVRNLLDKSKIKLLDNEMARVEINDWKLNLAGLGDVWANEFLPQKTFKNFSTEDSTATVVLSHNPDTKDELKSYPWDLMLCGHTHGGQVRLPFIGAPIAPVKDKRFVQGLHRWDSRWIYTTKGVGNLYGIRINCRPEVSLLTLV
jgi:predicted MPP superfamily phosphohydrolase